jgi:uncharacterized protein YecT (DUF1311 family)
MVRVLSEVNREHSRLSARLIATPRQPDPSNFSGGHVPSLKEKWQRSDTAFATYRHEMCDAVYVMSIEGTWRNLQELNCEVKVTRERIALLREILEWKGVFP